MNPGLPTGKKKEKCVQFVFKTSPIEAGLMNSLEFN